MCWQLSSVALTGLLNKQRYVSPSPASPLCKRKQIKGGWILKYKIVDIWHLSHWGSHWSALFFNLTVQDGGIVLHVTSFDNSKITPDSCPFPPILMMSMLKLGKLKKKKKGRIIIRHLFLDYEQSQPCYISFLFLPEFLNLSLQQYLNSSIIWCEQMRGTVADVGEGFSGGSRAHLGQRFLQSVQRAGRHSGYVRRGWRNRMGSAEIPAGTMTPLDSTS